MDDLSSLLCFQAVYQTLSISKAAKRMNLSKASVSKKIHALEIKLGSPLFVRNTRQIIPTKEAELLLDKTESIINSLNEIDSLFSKDSILKGKIRVTSNHSMTQKFFGNLLLNFQELYPDVTIELIATDNVLDPVENDIDISLRVNPPEQSPLIGKKVGNYQLHLVATPKYLKANPIRRMEELSSHPFMAIDAHFKARFEDSDKKINGLIKRRHFLCNDSVLVGQFIRESKGIGIRSNWDIKQALKDGQLKEILPSHPFRKSGDVWLLSHGSKLRIPRVNALFNYLEENLKVYF